MIARAYFGNTLLFTGAGFSLGSKNTGGNPLLLAKDLSKEICRLGKFEDDDDLAYSADYYLKYNNDNASKLIGFLKKSFSVEEVLPHHEQIASINWRRVYTTNYDNCYELAAGKIGKVISPITLDQSPAKYFRNNDICVHINGAIQTLDKESLETSFKLTESSYTNSDAFSDSSWAYRFKKDLEICGQIIFVGYSLYDMEIKRLLVDNENFKMKTFFVTRENVSRKEHHRLSAFGEVFPIGVENFGKLLEKNIPESLPEEMNYFSSLQKEELNFEKEFSDSDIRDLILRGKFNSDYIASSLIDSKSSYAILREQVHDVINILDKNNIAIIHGALANGKSILTQQVVSNLILEGKIVFTIRDNESNFEKDIEKLAELHQCIYLVVDDFEKDIDIIRYFSEYLGDNGKLILTERPHRYIDLEIDI